MSEDVTVDPECADLANEAYDIIRTIKDPEKSENLEELNVICEEFISVKKLQKDQFLISIEFAPTVPHCTLATLIGLCIRVKLQEQLVNNYKLDINIKRDMHYQAADISKQINDKERTAAAMENPDLMKIVHECIQEHM